MKKKSIIIFILVFVFGFLAGDFESKIIKKKFQDFKIRYFTKQDLTLDKNTELNNKKIIKANSYELVIEELISFQLSSYGLPEYVLRTAGFNIERKDNTYNYKIFFQDGQIINTKKIEKINLPKTIIYNADDKGRNIFHGGLKSVFSLGGKNFGIISNNVQKCDYLSIIELFTNNILLKGECLPNGEDPDFNGSGGAYFFDENNLYLTIGTPTSDSEKTSMLAQNEKSIYGKILKINKQDILQYQNENLKYTIFSKGHRNPQGIVKIDNKIFSTEHGPQGGDEINLIKENGNYGWPFISYGTRYGDGKSYKSDRENNVFINPLFSFIPSIAPSSLGKCPKNLADFYKLNICMLSLSLRDQSLFVILLDKETNRVQNIEKITLDKRMRHFGSNLDGNIFFDRDAFFISTDDLSILKVKFSNFR